MLDSACPPRSRSLGELTPAAYPPGWLVPEMEESRRSVMILPSDPSAIHWADQRRAVARAGFGACLILASLVMAFPGRAASPLLDSVKRNPTLAHQMCSNFKQLNAEGKSATSKASLTAVSEAQGLSLTDSEILVTYVIGLHCPDVR